MTAPEDLLAVAQDPPVVRHGVLYLAFDQVGRREPVPDGHGLHIARTLQALTILQAARQQPTGRHEIARSLVGDGEFIPRADGIRMARSVELLALADGPERDDHRVRGLADQDGGLGQANTSRRDSRVPGRELRLRSTSTRWYQRTASSASPAVRYAAAS